MTTVYLYRYEDQDGIVITPNKRNETDDPYCYRLISDEGYILTDGETLTPCVDTHEPGRYDEIEDETYTQIEPAEPDGFGI